MNRMIFIILSMLPLLSMAGKKFYVYKDYVVAGSPSGFMGANNGKSIKLIENYEVEPYQGKYSMLVRMDGSDLWGGFYIQASGHWRQQVKDLKQLANLKGYTDFVFYARSKTSSTIKIGFGENGEETFSNQVALTPEWKKYSFDVSDANLSYLNGIFLVSMTQAGEVQFDEIYYENKNLREEPEQVSAVFAPVKVEIKKLGKNNYRLYRDGKPYLIKGAGYQKNMYKAKIAGANSVRIWGHEEAKAALDSAQKHGMTVMLGLWLQHERHGFDYNDEEAVKYQIMKFKDVVDEFKGHPALLMWGIGNELDLFYSNKKVWNSVQEIAKYIHASDPNHPTCTVTAGLDTTEVPLIQKMCPDVDVFGVNSYAEVYNLPSWFRKAGLTRPYVVTEWGPTGNWECPKTSFDIGIEETSGEKADMYRERYQVIKKDSAMCIGSYAFFWGNKQETTPTWFGLFMPDGQTESEAIDVLQHCWTGKYPANRAPHLSLITINGKRSKENVVISPGQACEVVVVVGDDENEKISPVWEIMPESKKAKTGGDWEETPDAMPELITSKEDTKLKFTAPTKPGAYRVFYYGKDGNGNGAYGNVIFLVK